MTSCVGSQQNIMPLEGSFILAKPAMRPRMLFPAQRPAEGSNSYHYGSHATVYGNEYSTDPESVSIPLWFSRNSMLEVVV